MQLGNKQIVIPALRKLKFKSKPVRELRKDITYSLREISTQMMLQV